MSPGWWLPCDEMDLVVEWALERCPGMESPDDEFEQSALMVPGRLSWVHRAQSLSWYSESGLEA